MTELAKDLDQRDEQAGAEEVPAEQAVQSEAAAAGAPGPALRVVTEQEVLMGSAAAMAGPPARPTVWQRMREYFETWQSGEKKARDTDDRKPPRFYPERYDFVESAAMAREMWRL